MDYKKLTAPYEEEMLNNISKFVEINSVYDETTKDEANPFGKGVSNALAFITDLAKKDGFEVTNYDNMVVEILVGKGDKNITIMAHADVVPEGTGWDQDPFSVVNKDGVLYGRGVADDKGPLLSCYYGLKALRDNNLLGDYQVRFLVGGNEESGSLGIEHYFHTLNKPQPTLGFSPDSNYPLIFAEKEIIGFEVKSHIDLPEVISIHGGVASNSVIEKCVALVKKDNNLINFLKERNVNFDYEEKDELMEVIFHGVAAHGSIPWMGDNAGTHCLNNLGEYYKNNELILMGKYYTPTRGEGIKADAYSEDMGENSLNVGLINMENGDMSIIVNFRYTNAVTHEQMVEAITKNSKPFDIEFHGRSPLLYYPKDSVLVKTLLSAYQEETGDFDTPPMSTGGGTYAKEADNVIAFGMEFPGWDAHMHSPGECVKVEHLTLSMAIYARAIIELGKKL